MATFRVFGVVLGCCAVVALAQVASGPGRQMVVRNQGPTDRALDFPTGVLEAEFKDMIANKRGVTRMVEGGVYALNARYLATGEAPRTHKDITEFYFIREGTATLVTGGKVVNNAIQGGVERTVKPGDVILIPPGLPHALARTTGISYLNVHFGGSE